MSGILHTPIGSRCGRRIRSRLMRRFYRGPVGVPGALILTALTVFLVGCSNDQIQHSYGHRRGRLGGASVNGTGVLSEMFRQAGHRVHTRRVLSPKMESYDTIVWAPDCFALPSEESQAFLEDWLSNRPGRTLVYIGRDFDAEIAYWEDVLPQAPPDQAAEVTRRLAKARARHASERLSMPADSECRWFAIERGESRRRIGRGGDAKDSLHGVWCEGDSIDVSQVEITLEDRLLELEDPPTGTYGGELRSDVRLAAGRDILALRITNDDWPDSQIIVVPNGSFLLNLPLVEAEHRKLAAKLIEECEPAGKTAFLVSGPYGVSVFDSDQNRKYPTGLEAFTQWPVGLVLMHFIALGLIFLMCHVAIFGRSIQLRQGAMSDFGRHIVSLGQSIAKTQDEGYARRMLADYNELVQREKSEKQR